MKNRKPEFPILDLLLTRWSPRALSGEAIPKEELMQLFEAARWAPSSYNNQPWRFIYALRNTPDWQTFLELLTPQNQIWAQQGAALVVIISVNNFTYNGKLSRTHSFDTGAAWFSLALQGHSMGLVVHGLEGFDYAAAECLLHIPDQHTVEAMCVIGKPGKIAELPTELQKIEEPSDRNPLSSTVFEGKWPRNN